MSFREKYGKEITVVLEVARKRKIRIEIGV
jgi:hypothetical protein